MFLLIYLFKLDKRSRVDLYSLPACVYIKLRIIIPTKEVMFWVCLFVCLIEFEISPNVMNTCSGMFFLENIRIIFRIQTKN